MNVSEKVCVMMDDFEQRVTLKSLNEFRNTLIREELPTEDVEEMIMKVSNAEPLKRKDRTSRGVR